MCEGNMKQEIKGVVEKFLNNQSIAYDYDYYFTQPMFPYFYDRIKNLIENDNQICFAWSSDNDMAYLYQNCERYGKEQFNYVCYDIQQIADKFLNSERCLSLKEACKMLVGVNAIIKLQEHLSSDDAKMTMLAFQAVCTKLNIDSLTLLEQSEYAKDVAEEYIVRYIAANELKEKIKRKRNYYKSIVKSDKSIITDEIKRYMLSSEFIEKTDGLQSIVKRIHETNSVLVNSVDIADFILAFDEDDKNKIITEIDNDKTVVLLLNEIECKV